MYLSTHTRQVNRRCRAIVFGLGLSVLMLAGVAPWRGKVRASNGVKPATGELLPVTGLKRLTLVLTENIPLAAFTTNVTISGRVTNVNGRGLAGIKMQINDGSTDLCAASAGICLTDSSGAYSFAVTAGGSYTVGPKDSRVSTWFKPQTNPPLSIQQDTIFHNNLTHDVSDDNFTAGFPSFTVSGALKTQGGTVFPNQIVKLAGGASVNYTTNAQGKYTSDQLNVLGDYAFTPQPFTANGITYNTFSPANLSFVSMTPCDPSTAPPGVGCSGFNYATADFIAIPAPTVTTSAASSVTTTTATLNGSANPNGLATNAWFEWGTDSTLAINNATSSQAMGSGTTSQAISANLTNLTAGTTYYFRAVAMSSGGTVRSSILNFSSAPTPRTLSIASQNPASAVSVTVSPNDNNNAGNGTTPFTRTYNNNQVVSLTAPATASGNNFQKWLKDGADFANNTLANVNMTMDANHTMTAVYTTPKTIQLSVGSYSVGEGDGHVDITVTRSGDSSGAAGATFGTSDQAGTQNCSVKNGFASSRCDYLPRFATVNFAAGETSRTVSVLITDDSYLEGPETCTVSLSNPFGASLGSTASATVTINDNDSADGSNPIDVSRSFARQQYFDFLNREPDQSGLDFWTNNISGCSPQPSCFDVQRINTSAAFFLSIEFQNTGYLVERIYKTAFRDDTGNSTLPSAHQLSVPIVRFNEFLADTQQIGQSVVVLAPGWEQLLESNKQAFTLDFVQRPRFTAAFATSMSPARFVDQLFINAGVVPSANDRNAAIAEFGSATDTSDVGFRSRALRDVAENSILQQQEFNRAFVLMQFFGYLRRNPNDPQDTDYTGYDFWLTKLNAFNGDYLGAEMVKAFITSAEYRQRFGP